MGAIDEFKSQNAILIILFKINSISSVIHLYFYPGHEGDVMELIAEGVYQIFIL